MATTLPPLFDTRPSAARSENLLLRGLASLELTVLLLALSVFLVFAGTLAQIDGGIWTIVRDYFRSFVVFIPFKLFAQFTQIFAGMPADPNSVKYGFWFPGGWTIGGLMLANLLAAHLTRFRLRWNRAGVIALHAGLIVLMLGELAAGLFQVESRMTLGHGETVSFVEDSRVVELAIIDDSGKSEEIEMTIPQARLQPGGVITDPQLPVDVEVTQWYPNAELEPMRPGLPSRDIIKSKMGIDFSFFSKEESPGVEAGGHEDAVSARVRLLQKGTSTVIAEKLVSLWFTPNFTRRIPAYQFPPQTFSVDGKTYRIELRGRRDYLPFSLRLEEFKFDRYPGTEIPKNYSSRVTLIDPRSKVEREVLIRMNEPLAYEGTTYYQAGFTPDEKGTVLQATRNPGVWLPYISCVLVSLGMLIHFSQKLVAFLSRPRAVAKSPSGLTVIPSAGGWRWVACSLGATLVLAGMSATMRPAKVADGGFDYDAFGRLPCLDGGRVKPLDTVARVALTVINNKQSCKDLDGNKISPVKWLLDVMTLSPKQVDRSVVAKIPFFRIDNLDVVQQLGLENRPGNWRYSLIELKDKFDAIEKSAAAAQKIDAKKRQLADQKIVDLRRHLMEFLRLNSLRLAALPPPTGKGETEWLSVADYTPEAVDQQALAALKQQADQGVFDPQKLSEEQLLKLIREQRDKVLTGVPESARAFLAILGAYQTNDARLFNQAVAEFAEKHVSTLPAEVRHRADTEQTYNRAAPFFHLMYYYLTAVALAVIGWTLSGAWPRVASLFFSAGVGMTLAAFTVHVAALIARMYLMDRPLVFVTNLYSSALFIAACAVAFALVVEWMYGSGIGTVLGGSLAASGLFIGYALDLGVEGDKLEMMQAVLDTNFWLATHVTTVTAGYAATFLAGAVGIAFLGLAITAPRVLRQHEKTLAGVIYGMVCFATLLSFVGTVLGGIWADYSWGRFWGWDPKENGAMLIVLWNALVLHARWGGLVKAHGVAVLSIFGIAVTAWSWFGTNQLGIGLHSYGFTSAAAQALTAVFVGVTGLVMCGVLHGWLSRNSPPAEVTAAQAARR